MPRGSRLLTRALVATLLLGVPLAACAPGGPDRGPAASTGTTTAPTVSAPATPSPTPTAFPALGPLPDGVAPARPAALDQPPTLDGAKAVATYFLLLVPYAFQTGDVEVGRSLSDPNCVFCSSLATTVLAASQQGQHSQGGSIQVSELGGTEVDPGHFFNVKAHLTEAPSQTVTTSGVVAKTFAAAATDADMVVLYENGTWRVREVSYKASA